jgi:hypothetical protein
MLAKFLLENLKGRPKRRYEDNIRTDVRKVGWDDVDWMHLAQWWILVNTVMNFQVPSERGTSD